MTVTTAPAPGTREWQQLVTASKVAGILGISPWASPRSTWHVLRGEVPADDGRNTAAKGRGHYLENGVLDWWLDQHPDAVAVQRQPHITAPDLPWAAATPDLICDLADEDQPVIVDAKTARDDDEWGTPGTDEVPPYYAAQLQWAMHLTARDRRHVTPGQVPRAYIALLTNRLDLREYVIDYDPDTATAIEGICHNFWLSTQDPAGAPPIDDTLATFTTLRRLHAAIDPDHAIELDEPTAREFIEATQGLKTAEARDRKARSTVLDLMGQARLATHNGATVARRQPNAHGISLVAVAKTLPRKEDQ